ncbi:MAG: LemA family protein [Candidatus Limnocylindrales bacterium]
MGLAVVLVAVGGLVVLLTTYNGVVAMQRRADKAWANVDVALKQRYDELPNLVEAVRDVMAYERVVLEDVTNARAAYAPLAPLPSQAAASDATSAAVRSLFAVAERYPQLHAQANVMSLQAEIIRNAKLISRSLTPLLPALTTCHSKTPDKTITSQNTTCFTVEFTASSSDQGTRKTS